MEIFNTNQARHAYVVPAGGLKKLTGYDVDPATILTAAGNIAVGSIPDPKAEDFYFVYRNADGDIVRSDVIKICNIQYATAVTAAKLAIPLNQVTVTLNTANYANLAALVGKHAQVVVNLREFIGLDFSENYPIVADIYCNSTNTASAAAFYKAFEDELKGAIKNFKTAPFTVTSSAAGLVITEAEQKWVADKFSADPIHFSVITPVYGEQPWGTVSAPAASGSTVTGDFKLADLERFTHRERSEVLGKTVWPKDYEWTPIIKPVSGTSTYGVFTIQYYYAGNAEDVQKSPRTIQIIAPDALIGNESSTGTTTFFGILNTLKNGDSVTGE